MKESEYRLPTYIIVMCESCQDRIEEENYTWETRLEEGQISNIVRIAVKKHVCTNEDELKKAEKPEKFQLIK